MCNKTQNLMHARVLRKDSKGGARMLREASYHHFQVRPFVSILDTILIEGGDGRTQDIVEVL